MKHQFTQQQHFGKDHLWFGEACRFDFVICFVEKSVKSAVQLVLGEAALSSKQGSHPDGSGFPRYPDQSPVLAPVEP